MHTLGVEECLVSAVMYSCKNSCKNSLW